MESDKIFDNISFCFLIFPFIFFLLMKIPISLLQFSILFNRFKKSLEMCHFFVITVCKNSKTKFFETKKQGFKVSKRFFVFLRFYLVKIDMKIRKYRKPSGCVNSTDHYLNDEKKVYLFNLCYSRPETEYRNSFVRSI